MGLASAAPVLTEARIVWSMTTDMGTNPALRWMGPMIDAGPAPGLATLKALVEDGAG